MIISLYQYNLIWWVPAQSLIKDPSFIVQSILNKYKFKTEFDKLSAKITVQVLGDPLHKSTRKIN